MQKSLNTIIKRLEPIIELLEKNCILDARQIVLDTKIIGSPMHLGAPTEIRHLVWDLSELLIYGNSELIPVKEIVADFNKLRGFNRDNPPKSLTKLPD